MTPTSTAIMTWASALQVKFAKKTQLRKRYIAVYGDNIPGLARFSVEDLFNLSKSGHPDLFESWDIKEHAFLGNLEAFPPKKANGQEPESVWRLGQMIYFRYPESGPEAMNQEGIMKQLFAKT